MAYRVSLGTKISNASINKANVADNFIGRAILLGFDQIYAKQVAYDETVKAVVEVDQDAIIKYRFQRPMVYYYIPIARLNTDMYGRVVDDTVIIEYLRLSESQYDDFARQASEMGNFVSLQLKKVPKKGNDGKDYSFVDVIPSNYGANGVDIPSSVFAKVDQMVQTDGFCDGIWQMIDISTSISVAEYEKRLLEKQNQPQAQQPQTPSQAPQLAPKPFTPKPPQVVAPQQPRPLSAPQSVQTSKPVQTSQPEVAVITPRVPTASAASVMGAFKADPGNELGGDPGFDDFATGGFEAPEGIM